MEIRGHGGITHFGNSEGKGGSNMEAVRGMVRIFSGIAQLTISSLQSVLTCKGWAKGT